MKRLTLTSLTAISLLLLNGCSTSSLISHELNPRLPKLNKVKAVPNSTSVAFEWQPVATLGVDGINIYRTIATRSQFKGKKKELTKVGMVLNRYASHYVDTGLDQNRQYTYTFTTVKGGFESLHGEVINVSTKPPFEAVTFFQGFQKSLNSIKLIWRPHGDKRVKMYKIEKSTNSGKWKWVESVKNRMMSEFIDTYVAPGNRYSYRVIAVGFDDSFSKNSKTVTITAR